MSESMTATTDDDIGGYVSAATAVVGAWIVVAAFYYAPPPANFWNDVVVGAAIGIVAGYDAVRTDDEGVSTGAASLVALLGVWMVIAPFLFPVVTDAAFWNDVVNGALVAVLAGYNAYQSRETERRTPTAEAETR